MKAEKINPGSSHIEATIQVQLESLLKKYALLGTPIEVNFRALTPWIKMGERATHHIHSYPAKLIPQIAHFLTTAPQLSLPGDLVLDPFAGTGTVPLEALIAGRNAVAADANPLARLICRVKCRPASLAMLEHARTEFTDALRNIRNAEPPDVVNISHWYSGHVLSELSRIRMAIDQLTNEQAREVFLVTLSSVAKKLSLSDPRLSVPVRIRKEKLCDKPEAIKRTHQAHLDAVESADPVGFFLATLDGNYARLAALRNLQPSGRLMGIYNDARTLGNDRDPPEPSLDDSVDLVVTSPPYAGAQKYVRASYLGLGWTGLASRNQLKALESLSIGREHHKATDCGTHVETGIREADALLKEVYEEYPLRSHIAATYLNEMRVALASANSALKKSGHMILICGDNTVCGRRFPTTQFLKTLAEQTGLELQLELIDTIRARSLMTKRNATASTIKSEHIIILRKP